MSSLLDYVGNDRLSTAVIVLLAILVRILAGLSSYSGAGDAPKYGDYEAQRHWMELTVNLPVTEWYTDSPVNNASYWPLDYPPLSGYQSWLCGLVMRAVEPASVELVKSHGYETPSSKVVMRWTVIAADLLVYIPACLAAVHVFYGSDASASSPSSSPSSPSSPSATARRPRVLALIALLFNPAAIVIDHGHFQYNNISLGLTLAAVAAIGGGHQLLGAALFSAALNHKQMALFFAPAFFAHLLGWALHSKRHRGLGAKVLAVVKLGLTVIATFAVCWAPYLWSKEAVLQVLIRIFPVRRGLYEDYVANWWCTSSLLIKWKTKFSAPVLLRAAAATTLAAAAPAMAHQILGRPGDASGGCGPTRWGLLRCLANSSFAFFMFSYQVHEKSILLPLLPVTLLAGREPTLAAWLPLLAALSMFPLLERDGVALVYAALCTLYGAIMVGPALELAKQWQQAQASSKARKRSSRLRQMMTLLSGLALRYWVPLACLAVAGALGLHAARWTLPPPEWLPWIHDRTFITAAFGGFALAFLHLQASQWLDGEGRATVAKAHGKAD